MSNITCDLLVHGIAAAKRGAKVESERYRKRLLRLNLSVSGKIEVHHRLAEPSNDPVVEPNFIGHFLAGNPGDARAHRKLAILNGDLHPDQSIDPDQLEIDHKTNRHTQTREDSLIPTVGQNLTSPRNLLSGSCLSRVHRIKLVISLTASGHPPILSNPINILQH